MAFTTGVFWQLLCVLACIQMHELLRLLICISIRLCSIAMIQMQLSKLQFIGKDYRSFLNVCVTESSVSAGRKIRWCAIGEAEKKKCDEWFWAVNCVLGTSAEDCIQQIMVNGNKVLHSIFNVYLIDQLGQFSICLCSSIKYRAP